MLHLTQARSQPAVKRQARHPAAHASEAEVPVSTTAVVATSAWIVDPLDACFFFFFSRSNLCSVLFCCTVALHRARVLDVRVHA